ncbi:hypothetical protein PMAYCL1PPCAC_25058, partial [Pristionchus mayeri]
SECALLKFADEILIKIVGVLPMEDRLNVRVSCSRLEIIVAKTDLEMDTFMMKFNTFDGSPMSTPFGLQRWGIDSTQLEEFMKARARLTRRIKLSRVSLDQIDFDNVDFDAVRLLLSHCIFENLLIVQGNIDYNNRVGTLIKEYEGKKIVLSALYFPYFECIERLPVDVELRFNYLHRNRAKQLFSFAVFCYGLFVI